MCSYARPSTQWQTKFNRILFWQHFVMKWTDSNAKQFFLIYFYTKVYKENENGSWGDMTSEMLFQIETLWDLMAELIILNNFLSVLFFWNCLHEIQTKEFKIKINKKKQCNNSVCQTNELCQLTVPLQYYLFTCKDCVLDSFATFIPQSAAHKCFSLLKIPSLPPT